LKTTVPHRRRSVRLPTPFVSTSVLHVRALYFGAGDIRN
jgi:hypothetical protein